MWNGKFTITIDTAFGIVPKASVRCQQLSDFTLVVMECLGTERHTTVAAEKVPCCNPV
jgi:hypothetical protein